MKGVLLNVLDRLRNELKQTDWNPVCPYLVIIAAVAFLTLFLHAGEPQEYAAYGATNQAANGLLFGISAEGWTAIFTGVLTVSTIGLWWQTRGLAKVGRDQTAAEFRPWVQISNIRISDGVSMISSDGLNISLTYTCKNVGRTPALHMAMHAVPMFAPPPNRRRRA